MRYREDMQMREKLDVLNRQEFIDTLLQLVGGLADKQQGCCFGIEGVWGSGKSFVIEKFEEQLKDIQSEETCDNKYFVFHYDYPLGIPHIFFYIALLICISFDLMNP